MRKSALIAASLSLVTVATARAQDVGAMVGYAALVSTPAGAMSPAISNAMLGRMSTSSEFAFRYGHMSDAFNAIGVSASMPLSGFTVGGTLGYASPSNCSGCDGNAMLGLDAETRLGTMPMSNAKDAPSLNFGGRADFGWANPSDGVDRVTALGLSVGVPVSLVAHSGNNTIAPFVTPGFGWGRLSASGSSESGSRFMMGGGLGVMNRNGWGVAASLQKVFIDGGKSVFGLNVSYAK